MRRAVASLFTVFSIVFVVIVIGRVTIVLGQSQVTGEWRSEARSNRESRDSSDAEKPWRSDRKDINIQFERWKGADSHNSIGCSFTYAELGLSEQQVKGGGPVRFRLGREAGTIDGEGAFQNGDGKGTFTFTPNMGFVSTMRSKGFDFENPRQGIRFNSDDKDRTTVEERLLSAALLNVTTALADDLNSANFGKLDVDDLFKAAIFHIDGKFMAEMKATGFPDLSMEDLVKARIFRIDADYVRQIHDMGFDNRSFEDLVKFRIFKVTPEFLAELRNAGVQDLKAEEVVKCRIFKIDGDFVRKARAEDPNASIEDMVRMKIGVGRRSRSDGWQ